MFVTCRYVRHLPRGLEDLDRHIEFRTFPPVLWSHRRPLKRVDEGDSATDLDALVDNLIGDGVVKYRPSLTSEGG